MGFGGCPGSCGRGGVGLWSGILVLKILPGGRIVSFALESHRSVVSVNATVCNVLGRSGTASPTSEVDFAGRWLAPRQPYDSKTPLRILARARPTFFQHHSQDISVYRSPRQYSLLRVELLNHHVSNRLSCLLHRLRKSARWQYRRRESCSYLHCLRRLQ